MKDWKDDAMKKIPIIKVWEEEEERQKTFTRKEIDDIKQVIDFLLDIGDGEDDTLGKICLKMANNLRDIVARRK